MRGNAASYTSFDPRSRGQDSLTYPSVLRMLWLLQFCSSSVNSLSLTCLPNSKPQAAPMNCRY